MPGRMRQSQRSWARPGTTLTLRARPRSCRSAQRWRPASARSSPTSSRVGAADALASTGADRRRRRRVERQERVQLGQVVASGRRHAVDPLEHRDQLEQRVVRRRRAPMRARCLPRAVTAKAEHMLLADADRVGDPSVPCVDPLAAALVERRSRRGRDRDGASTSQGSPAAVADLLVGDGAADQVAAAAASPRGRASPWPPPRPRPGPSCRAPRGPRCGRRARGRQTAAPSTRRGRRARRRCGRAACSDGPSPRAG